MKKNIIFAGVSFPCGIEDIASVANECGYNPYFLDHQHYQYALSNLSPTIIGDDLPIHLLTENTLVINLLESWVSASNHHSSLLAKSFDTQAYKISRSKQKLSDILYQNHLEYNPRIEVLDKNSAIESAKKLGFPLVLRSDCGYSSKGVYIVNHMNEFHKFWDQLLIEHHSLEFKQMFQIMNESQFKYIIEPYLESTEWSCDCMITTHGVFLIRVCTKITKEFNGQAKHIGFWLETNTHILKEIEHSIKKWIPAIFSKPKVTTYACFDIRRNHKGHLIPIDFAMRLGFDSIPFLTRAAYIGKNPYADALGLALGLSSFLSYEPNWGFIRNIYEDNISFLQLTKKQIKSKYIIKLNNRIFVCQKLEIIKDSKIIGLICQFDDYEDFSNLCLGQFN